MEASMDESEKTAAGLAGVILVVRSLVIAQALRDAKADPQITPTQAAAYIASFTRELAEQLLGTLPEAHRAPWRGEWEGIFRRCFELPEGIDLQDAFLRAEPPSGARN
jgi:hypothetical protein